MTTQLTPDRFLYQACPQTLAAALDPVEARAYQIHLERKADRQREYPWAEPLTFDGGERDYCLLLAREALAA